MLCVLGLEGFGELQELDTTCLACMSMCHHEVIAVVRSNDPQLVTCADMLRVYRGRALGGWDVHFPISIAL